MKELFGFGHMELRQLNKYVYVSPSSTKTASIPLTASIPDVLNYPGIHIHPDTLIISRASVEESHEPTVASAEGSTIASAEGPAEGDVANAKKPMVDSGGNNFAVKIVGIYHLHLDFTTKKTKEGGKRNRPSALQQAPAKKTKTKHAPADKEPTTRSQPGTGSCRSPTSCS
ncbi:hypothetical protein BT96DRAFT_992742 [Gymnopus androsaceus JB14]|uniref:Uncharacterized protein n=1 Tax=Gymnopus androsaceus JB14 TaxID=1447944 RepID=A0A6A4HR95_9AGAR|nr:hypothetical protein BT96DRAFT_992742 [Gymnopus androsaceus JB14]